MGKSSKQKESKREKAFLYAGEITILTGGGENFWTVLRVRGQRTEEYRE